MTEPADCTALWQRYWATRDRDARNDLILAYEPLVHTVVSRLPANVRAYWEVDDLRSFGLLGLVEAIDRWEPSTTTSRFATYATKRVRGAIFDELRRLDWLPRTVRRRVISYRATVDALSSELGRVPGTSEVLSSMGVDGRAGTDLLAEVQSAQLLHLQHSVGSDQPDEDVRLIDLLASDRDVEPELQVLASERIAEIRQAVTKLPDRQRTVVTLHFLAGLTQEQIGAMLGVSNSRVCQIEASAIQTLRRLLVSTDNDQLGAAAEAG
ncbi:MAG TPA: sigma-70 family RNA polymerase sigma factor [Acidimicrobiales bacterium]|nr:sigma-70 family RNA polymerase sigma factor [Acidimicrobiales bacterium]